MHKQHNTTQHNLHSCFIVLSIKNKKSFFIIHFIIAIPNCITIFDKVASNSPDGAFDCLIFCNYWTMGNGKLRLLRNEQQVPDKDKVTTRTKLSLSINQQSNQWRCIQIIYDSLRSKSLLKWSWDTRIYTTVAWICSCCSTMEFISFDSCIANET